RSAVGEVGDAAGGGETAVGGAAGGVVVAALPVGVTFDGGDLGGLDADLPGAGPGGDGDDAHGVDLVRVHQRPLQGAGATHGTAEDGVDPGDAEGVEELLLRGDLVADGDRRETGSPAAAVGVLGGGAGRPLAAADDVGAHDAPRV